MEQPKRRIQENGSGYILALIVFYYGMGVVFMQLLTIGEITSLLPIMICIAEVVLAVIKLILAILEHKKK